MEYSNEITESQLNNKGLFFCLTEKNELSNTKSVARKMTESPVENVDTEEEIYFYDLTIPGDYSDYGILYREKKLYQIIMKLGSNPKRRYGEGG